MQAAISNDIPNYNGMRCVPDAAMDGMSHASDITCMHML
jgi:hypothetical protein